MPSPRLRGGALALGILVGLQLAACENHDTPLSISTQAQRTMQPLTPSQGWALATSAVLWERNQHRHDSLGGNEPAAANVAATKRILKDWWGVTGRAVLI